MGYPQDKAAVLCQHLSPLLQNVCWSLPTPQEHNPRKEPVHSLTCLITIAPEWGSNGFLPWRNPFQERMCAWECGLEFTHLFFAMSQPAHPDSISCAQFNSHRSLQKGTLINTLVFISIHKPF